MAIYRGPGGAGDANSDITINLITELTQEAEGYKDAAASSATAAASSATAASSSASSASTSATNAATSATASATSATAASTAQTAAETAETNAETAETNAGTSATAAAASATSAASSATSASTSATNAATSETNAATSASNASTSETNAATSATSASTSASSASTSASAAATSATTASTAATNAANSFDSFDDRYLGAKASAPTLDNDGEALLTGALYWDTTDTSMKVYDGSAWQDAYANGADFVATTDIGVTVQAYDVDTLKADVADTLTAPFRGTVTTDNDLSFDMSVTNHFKCTPTANGTLTFTNITAGQSGNIWLDNSGGYTISAASSTYIASADLTTISTAGVYFLSYYSDGTNVMVSATPAVTSAGA